MELNEFIASTIDEIFKGVKETQRNYIMGTSRESMGETGGNAFETESFVEFDIAVTFEEKNLKKGKANGGAIGRILVANAKVNLSGEIESAKAKNRINRVGFKVPIKYPKL